MYCTKPQAKGYHCIKADGHPGACDVAKKSSRLREWWDRLNDSLFT